MEKSQKLRVTIRTENEKKKISKDEENFTIFTMLEYGSRATSVITIAVGNLSLINLIVRGTIPGIKKGNKKKRRIAFFTLGSDWCTRVECLHGGKE